MSLLIPSWLSFILAVLAVYRIAFMLAREDGPFDIFATIRGKVGQETWYGRGLHCVLCMSFWIALPAAIIINFPWFIGWLGIAGGVLVLFMFFEKVR
jgi:hypothetical protein